MTDIRDSDALKQHIDSYLVGLKASMWANWFIDAADRRALAVEWVAELLHGLGFQSYIEGDYQVVELEMGEAAWSK